MSQDKCQGFWRYLQDPRPYYVHSRWRWFHSLVWSEKHRTNQKSIGHDNNATYNVLFGHVLASKNTLISLCFKSSIKHSQTSSWKWTNPSRTYQFYHPDSLNFILHYKILSRMRRKNMQKPSQLVPTWFMSMVWTASPRVKITAWFWFSGFPSPNMGFPGSFME